MTNLTDVSDMKMTRFGYRVDLIRERHVRVKDEAEISSRETDREDFIAELSENLRCGLVPLKRNSVFDGLRKGIPPSKTHSNISTDRQLIVNKGDFLEMEASP